MTHLPTTRSEDSRRWLILALVSLAQLMVVLDVTVVNIALPSAQRALGFSDGDRQWIVTAYALAFGGLLPLGGRLGDLLGRKRTLLIGLAGFSAISALAGMAQSFEWLVATRALQGAFAALIAPAALSALSTTFTEPADRGKAFGIYGAIVGSGAAVGLLLGGLLTEYLSWRWCLYVNLVLAVPALFGTIALLNHDRVAPKAQLDLPGALTASGGLFALVYGFSHAQSAGWSALTTVGFLAVGVALLTVFISIQRRSQNPLMPLRVLADRNRASSYLAVLIAGSGVFGTFLFLTYYLQQTLGYSPVTNGLAFLPMIAAVMLTSTSANSLLLARLGPRPLITAGMAAAAVGMALLTRLGLHAAYALDILPALLLIGAGIGLVMAPAMNTATAGIRPGDSGIASALVNTSQQIGGSIGTALLNTLATSATASYLATHRTGQALAAHATLHGYTVAFWTSAGVFALGAILCGLLLGSRTTQPLASAEPVLVH
ncbi:MAG: MFS transporter [Actinobacteria bacterium]|nr:MAG: MFS transporter [Actinomycetota bacterium]